MRFFFKCFVIFNVVLISPCTFAGWSSTATISSDYLFNGISQTRKNPAYQLSIDWSADNGFYAGAWGSNVDLAFRTNTEVDLYAGFYRSLSDSVSVDAGIAQYTYWGTGDSSLMNFPEVFTKLNVGNAKYSVWYSWDYFGSNARHYVAMFEYTYTLTPNYSLLAELDTSVSLDKSEWSWQPNDEDYVHGQLALLFSIDKFDFSLAVHHTDLSIYDRSTLVLSVSRLFEL